MVLMAVMADILVVILDAVMVVLVADMADMAVVEAMVLVAMVAAMVETVAAMVETVAAIEVRPHTAAAQGLYRLSPEPRLAARRGPAHCADPRNIWLAPAQPDIRPSAGLQYTNPKELWP